MTLLLLCITILRVCSLLCSLCDVSVYTLRSQVKPHVDESVYLWQWEQRMRLYGTWMYGVPLSPNYPTQMKHPTMLPSANLPVSSRSLGNSVVSREPLDISSYHSVVNDSGVMFAASLTIALTTELCMCVCTPTYYIKINTYTNCISILMTILEIVYRFLNSVPS